MTKPRNESTLPKWAQQELADLRSKLASASATIAELRAGYPPADGSPIWIDYGFYSEVPQLGVPDTATIHVGRNPQSGTQGRFIVRPSGPYAVHVRSADSVLLVPQSPTQVLIVAAAHWRGEKA